MSALPPKADVDERDYDVRIRPVENGKKPMWLPAQPGRLGVGNLLQESLDLGLSFVV
jgi:hypothetical protein